MDVSLTALPADAGDALGSQRINVVGIGISRLTMSRALRNLGQWIESGTRTYVCVTGVHGVVASMDDPRLRAIHNRSGMTTPDGMPMVWAAHRAGADEVERVYGPDLMLAASEAGAATGWRMFFYGGKPGVAERLAARLQDRYPGLVVAGTHSPPFGPLTASDADRMVAEINAARADIVWVGLSTPKQEYWMAHYRDRLHASVLIGVGAAFDFHAGDVAQAPLWMQRSGLEWLYRIYSEPRRLWRRYAEIIPRFVLGVVRDQPRLMRTPDHGDTDVGADPPSGDVQRNN